MLLIQSAPESPLPCTNTTGGGPTSAAGGRLGGAACGWRGGPCCWASTSEGHSAATPDSSVRRRSIDRLVLSPPDMALMLAKAGNRRYACHMSLCYVDTLVGRLALEADHDAVTGLPPRSPRPPAPASGLLPAFPPPLPLHTRPPSKFFISICTTIFLYCT